MSYKNNCETILYLLYYHIQFSDEEDVKMDSVVTLQAMSAILPYAPPTQMLHFPCINHFHLCLQNSDPKVRLKGFFLNKIKVHNLKYVFKFRLSPNVPNY